MKSVSLTVDSAVTSIHSNTAPAGIVVHSIEGLAYPNSRLSSYNRPGEFGSIVSNVLYSGRPITIIGSVYGNTVIEYETRRQTLESALRIVRSANAVSLPSTLKFTTMNDIALQADVFIKDFKMLAKDLHIADFFLELYSPDYALFSQTLQSVSISRSTGGGSVYPFIYPIIYGAQTGGEQTFVNSGNVESYPIIYLNGPLTNPVIQNVTLGRSISLNLVLSSTDQVVINMKERTIVKNENESVIAYRTDDSRYWWLLPGNNVVRFFTGSSGDTGNAQIQFRDAFLGA